MNWILCCVTRCMALHADGLRRRLVCYPYHTALLHVVANGFWLPPPAFAYDILAGDFDGYTHDNKHRRFTHSGNH